MDKSKLLEFFDASKLNQPVNIIGCGAIGSHICEEVARLGFENVHIYDFDTVAAHNVTNQMFTQNDIGQPKTAVCAAMMTAINPDMKIVIHPEGIKEPYVISGYIIMCVDNIDVRKAIVNANRYNPNCLCIMDYRMRLTDAQHYFAATAEPHEVETLLNTMNFTQEEAAEATPTSACGVELSVVYTVKAITAYGMANFVNWLLGNDYKTLIVNYMATLDILTCKTLPKKKSIVDTLKSNVTPATE